jgi:hypothetical protein
MRFCPFCSAENADELTVCQACGRRLPPLPPRRAQRGAAGGGVAVPPRPPPVPPARTSNNQSAVQPQPQPPSPHDRPDPPWAADADKRALMNAISPGPAAQRREPPPPEPASPFPDHSRREGDVQIPRSKVPTQPPPIAGGGAPFSPPAQARTKPPTQPPPQSAPVIPSVVARAKTPSKPPPVQSFDDDFFTMPSSQAYPDTPAPLQVPEPPVVAVASTRQPVTGVTPPPTRVQRPDATDRPFTPPRVDPVPEIPEPGLVTSAKYTVRFWKARWQRRGAIKTLGAEIKQDTEALDQVLGALGREARNARVEGRVFSAENAAIGEAEQRIQDLIEEHGDVDARKADENSKFVDVERERATKLSEAERHVEEVQKELLNLEGQRRGLRDKRRDLERRQKAYLKNAEDNDRQSANIQMGDQRQELRRSAEDHRRSAAALEPERQDLDRRLAALERPIGESTAKLDAAKAELDAAKRSLNDAREGHHHRLAELDSEQKRKAREIGQAEGEIARRLVTLGTLVNLNRIEDAQFDELYQRIDRLRGAITARTTEIEKLTAEREAYDRGTLVRGVSTIGGAIVLFIALIVILRAIL